MRYVTAKEIVKDYLKKNGFDGLANDKRGCCCEPDEEVFGECIFSMECRAFNAKEWKDG